MRCTRCDRPVIPQAVGRTRDGRVVFGWCLSCLDEEGCVEVHAAVGTIPSPRKALRQLIRRRPLRPRQGTSRTLSRSNPIDDRRKVVSAVALVLALWGTALLVVGLNLRARVDPRTMSPLGNGTPSLLIFGGGTTGAVGLSLWAMISGRAVLGSRAGLKGIQVFAFLAAMAVLAFGILFRTPRRDPLVVAATTVAMAVSVVARWVELRRFGPVARLGRD